MSQYLDSVKIGEEVQFKGPVGAGHTTELTMSIKPKARSLNLSSFLTDGALCV